MNRKIKWTSGALDEIELIYEKAKNDEAVGGLLEQLETQALREARENSGMLKSGNQVLSPEQFDLLPDADKEQVIAALGGAGLTSLNMDLPTGTFTARLSPLLPKVQACTVFNLLNRIEKLDGSINLLKPSWKLVLQVPIGGRKNLFQWELLLLKLYPWLTVSDEVTNEVAPVPPTAPKTEKDTTGKNEDTAESEPAVTPTPEEKTEKAAEESSAESSDDSPSESFQRRMSAYKAYTDAYAEAKKELETVLKKKRPYLAGWKDCPTLDAWRGMDENGKFNKILSVGFYSIIFSACVCVDFAVDLPNCIAIALLYLADSGEMTKQTIDAGDEPGKEDFVAALTALHGCCSNWECTVVNPIIAKIGTAQKTAAPETKDSSRQATKKKSFWKKLFG